MICPWKDQETIEIRNIIYRIANEKLETKQNIQFQLEAGVIFIHLTHILLNNRVCWFIKVETLFITNFQVSIFNSQF